MTALPTDNRLMELDYAVAYLTREAVRYQRDAQKAKLRGDYQEVERLQDISEALSAEGDKRQAELDQLIDDLVGSNAWRVPSQSRQRPRRKSRRVSAPGAAAHRGRRALQPARR